MKVAGVSNVRHVFSKERGNNGFLNVKKIADVWSCGVTLYVMLVGAYPFEDPEDPRNFCKTIGVIDYKTQQSRLFPLLATTYAYRFVGEWLKWLYKDMTQRLQSCDFSTLPEAHACTAGLKSLTTSITAAILGVGTKLQAIITQMALEIQDRLFFCQQNSLQDLGKWITNLVRRFEP